MNPPTTPVKHDGTEATVLTQLGSAIFGKPSDDVLKNVVKLLRETSDHYDWVGIYLTQGDNLILKAYAGVAETEHVTIPIGQGICGLAAKQGATVVVRDVSKDPRYLMCFPSTRSEIVVPIKVGNRVFGEIDIDSDRLSAFTPQDQEILEQAATLLASYLEKQGDRREAYKVLQ
jgi:L-methionine (R)-S-oxide reductase